MATQVTIPGMRTIDCRIQVDEFNNVAAADVTPAEVLVIRKIHTKGAKGDPIKEAGRKGIALRNGQVRTDREEHDRLRLKYPTRNPKTDKSIVEEVLGPVFNALPHTFDELETSDGPHLEIGVAKAVSAEEKQKPEVTWGSAKPEAVQSPESGVQSPEGGTEPTVDQRRADLLGLNKASLIAVAQGTPGVVLAEEDTKAVIAKKILIELGLVEPEPAKT